MKIKISLGQLSVAWGILNTAVPQRSPRPILSNIKVVCDKQVELMATDLEIGIRYRLDEAEVIEPGEILVNAEKVGRILRENPSEQVELSSTDGVTRLTYKQDEFHLPSEEPANFPEIVEYKGSAKIEVERDVLQTLLRQSAFAAAHEETRYALNGVLFQAEGSKLFAVATDGKRLSLVKAKCKGAKGTAFRALVPLKGVQALEKILSQEDDIIELAADDGNLYAKTARADVVCRLLEGNFPEYEEVVPKGYENKIVLNRQELSSKLRLADAFTTDDSRSVKIRFEKETMTISAQGPDTGEAKVTMNVAYTGEPMEIAFNPQYVLDGTKVVSDETITMELKDSNSSAKITAGEGFTYVVMPLSLD